MVTKQRSKKDVEHPAGVNSTQQLRALLDRVSFRPSCLDMGWKWEVKMMFEAIPGRQRRGGPIDPDDVRFLSTGWQVRGSFRRPDTDTGSVGTGFGRWEPIRRGASSGEVVKTLWVIVEMIVKHELMEAFCFDGARVFDPHRTLSELIARPRR